MTGSQKTLDLDKCIVSRFGEATLPPLKTLEIDRFSKIPDLIKDLRALKYGPKLKFVNTSINEVTTKYQAGYSGTDSRKYGYAESIMMEYGSKMMSHASIRKQLLNIKNSGSVATLFSKISDIVKKIDKDVSNFDQFEEKLLQDIVNEVAPATQKIPGMSIEKREQLLFKILHQFGPTFNNWDSYLGEVLNDKFEHLFKDCDPIINSDVTSRILTIWFIAESFRYPPMMLYSFLLLHLFVNDHLSGEEFEEVLHPSEIEESEKAQFYCYLRETEILRTEAKFPRSSKGSIHIQDYLNSTKSRYEETIKSIENKKFELLKKVRDGIYANFQKLKYTPEKSLRFSNLVFKACIKRYLIICIGDEAFKQSDLDLTSLAQSLGKVGRV
ncbi:MAG: hypothetical protein K2X08_04110 [Chlamydiales bacterium]|nr:hypothetical protein [Chlamydiales bacterium]MBY0529914.1 hypothetical protein [Rhabdochlamydiaceae bacterium]